MARIINEIEAEKEPMSNTLQAFDEVMMLKKKIYFL